MKKTLIFIFLSSIIFAQDYLIKVNDFSINENEFVKNYENSLKVFGLQTTIDNLIEKQLLLEHAKKLNLETENIKVKTKIEEYKNDNIFKILELEDKRNEILNFTKNSIDKRLVIKLVSFNINSPFLKADSLLAKNKITEIKKIFDNKKNIGTKTKNIKTEEIEINHLKVPFVLEENAYKIKNLNESSDIFFYQGAYHFIVLKEVIKYKSNYTLRFLAVDKTDSLSKNIIDKAYQDLTKNKLTVETVLKKYTFNKSTVQSKGEPYIAKSVDIPTHIILELESLKNNEFTKPIDSGNSYLIFQLIESKAFDINNVDLNKELEKEISNDFTKVIFDEEVVKQAKKYFKISENKKNVEEFRLLAEKSYLLNNDILLLSSKNSNESYFEINGNKIASLKEVIENWNHELKNKKIGVNFETYINIFKSKMLNQAYIFNAYNNAVNYNLKVKNEFISFKENLLSAYVLKELNEKSLVDSISQKEYYNLNSKNYVFNKRGKGTVYICQDQEMQTSIFKNLKNEEELNKIKSEYSNKISKKNKYYLDFYIGEFDLNNKLLPKDVVLKKGVQLMEFKNYYYVIDFNEILKKSVMDFVGFTKNLDDDYKNFYINKKIQDLKNKSIIEINQEKIKSLKQKYQL